MQEDTSFRGDVIGLCISINGRHTEGKGRHQRGLSRNIVYYYWLILSGQNLYKPRRYVKHITTLIPSSVVTASSLASFMLLPRSFHARTIIL